MGKIKPPSIETKEDIQALLVLGSLVETIVAVGAASTAHDLNRLLRIASPLRQIHGSPLRSLPSCVHHVVNLSL